jgi:uncharacterized protein YacL
MADPIATRAPTAKVAYATGGSVVGTAVAQLLIYTINRLYPHAIVPTIAPYVVTVIVAGFTFTAGWLKAPGAGETTMADVAGKTVTAKAA